MQEITDDLGANMGRLRFWSNIYYLPLLHLTFCILSSTATFARGWELLTYIDVPFSFILVGLAWHYEKPFLVFGGLGTLWWLLLSWAGASVYRSIKRHYGKQMSGGPHN